MRRCSRARLAVCAAISLALAGPTIAWAAPAPTDEHLLYNVMFGGLHVGDLQVTLKQNDTGYSTEMNMSARGVMKFLKNFRADMHGEGAFVQKGTDKELMPQPAQYNRAWSTDEFAANMTMNFDPATHTATTKERVFNPATGEDVKREDMPWNNRRTLKPVPADMRTNVFDPMAAFIAGRQQLMAQGGMEPGKTFRVPIYDGSRRYDVVGKTGAVRTVTINGKEQLLLPVTTKIEPVFGFTRDSEEGMRSAEGKIYFTPDERFIPVQVVAGNDMFTGVLNLAADCGTSPQACVDADAANITN